MDIIFRSELENFLREDGLEGHWPYWLSLPQHEVTCDLYLKSDLVLCGTPFFHGVFELLSGAKVEALQGLRKYEGQKLRASKVPFFSFKLPFAVAITGERLALNLLANCSAIATETRTLAERAKPFGIKILETRKTLPGLKAFQKYAVQIGGGYNHRTTQTDVWMIKDNHKSFFGGIAEALDFFKGQGALYQNTVVEIHLLEELQDAIHLGVRHFLLDNFSVEMVKSAVEFKKEGMTFELSGGIREANLDQYLILGVDAISIGALTYSPKPVDLSLKMRK